MLVYGSLDIDGQLGSPVLLSSSGSDWSGVVVLGEGGAGSTWTYATVENTSSVNRDGWVLTGGITFYKNNPSLREVVIQNSTAEDAINIVRASFEFQNVGISGTASDGFDGDFTQGTITDCQLMNISGDGLDFSGSNVSIQKTSFSNIGDKAVSVGESSLVSITDSDITSANIGVASKDLSQVTIRGIQINDVKVAGLAAYIKKPQYGPASIDADGIDFSNTALEALCQIGSTISLSGKDIECQEVDVESLYDQGILGN
jgi:hypothetical protein